MSIPRQMHPTHPHHNHFFLKLQPYNLFQEKEPQHLKTYIWNLSEEDLKKLLSSYHKQNCNCIININTFLNIKLFKSMNKQIINEIKIRQKNESKTELLPIFPKNVKNHTYQPKCGFLCYSIIISVPDKTSLTVSLHDFIVTPSSQSSCIIRRTRSPADDTYSSLEQSMNTLPNALAFLIFS